MSFSMPPSIVGAALLRPVVALNVWTLFMEAWLYQGRIPAISKYKVPVTPNATKEEFNRNIPPHIRWKADNYNHLLEQPTQFYAIAITLALIDPNNSFNTQLAWAYVGIRVVHSLVQATVNKIMVRFGLFATSSIVLSVLTARAATALF